MKNISLIKYMIVTVLICLPLLAASQSASNSASPAGTEAKTQMREVGVAKNSGRSAAYTGYEIDGRTSASVLAAKRSHEVSSRDKNGLAIFSGIFVIGLVVFFSQVFFKKK